MTTEIADILLRRLKVLANYHQMFRMRIERSGRPSKEEYDTWEEIVDWHLNEIRRSVLPSKNLVVE